MSKPKTTVTMSGFNFGSLTDPQFKALAFAVSEGRIFSGLDVTRKGCRVRHSRSAILVLERRGLLAWHSVGESDCWHPDTN